METRLYQLPQCDVIDIDHQAVLCSSPGYDATTEGFSEFNDLEMN